MKDPLKQGLKLNIPGLSSIAYISWSERSIKTRIETTVFGLIWKAVAISWSERSIKTRIETHFFGVEIKIKRTVEVKDPLKQGLKQ